MRAIVYERYGPPEVLELREVPEPTLGEGDVLVRVRAASVGAGDWHLLSCTWPAIRLYQGLLRPKRRVLGHDVSGVVEAVGTDVTRFRPGDEVFGSSLDAGGFAELVRVAESGLVPLPSGLSHEEAAAVPSSGLAALQGLRDHGHVRAGEEVLVNGASGGVGTFAVQIARHFGARVTGVCSAGKMELVRSLGAERVLDYGEAPFTQRPERYDLILDNVGSLPVAECRRALRPGGRYVAVSGAPSRSLRIALLGGRRMRAFVSHTELADLGFLKELLEAGELRAVLDRRFPLEEVPEALRRFGSGQARGKIVIVV